MTRLTMAKIVLGIGGLVVFGIGVRVDRPGWRWVAVGMVAVAWLLRFIRTGPGA